MERDIIRMALIMTQLALAVTNDVYCYKVKNEINFTFAITGILYNVFTGSQTNIYFGILGLIIPFVILLPLYILNMLGAGDIKLFCSIGALLGIGRVLLSIALSFGFGLVIALLIMASRRNFIFRIKKLYVYLKGCFLCKSIMPYYQLKINKDGRMHFTIPIALGTITTFFI